jgi:multiple sugar transport system ATP-binding protein
MTMGDRVAVMRKGELQQVDEPQNLYDRPVNLFVGGFIGSPSMNLLEAKLERTDGVLAAVAGSQRIALGEETLSARPGLKNYEGRAVILGIRPEDLEDAELEPDRGQTIEGTVELTEALGSEIMAHFSIDAPPAITDEVRELQEDAGTTEVGLPTQEESGGRTIMVGRFGARSKAAKGEPIRAAVDTRALHFFDPETGLGIYEGTEREGARG